MLTSFSCGQCGTVLEADVAEAGLARVCPHCRALIRVPVAAQDAVAVAPVLPSSESERILPRDELERGAVLDGFCIKRLIGRGGVGEVYLAEELVTGRDVALKILPRRSKEDPETVALFLAEAQTASEVCHPNLVPVWKSGEAKGICFLAMPFIDGETLETRLARDGAMAETAAMAIVAELAAALAEAWESHGLIHCDVKPGNIMLDRAGKLYLMDMGLSRLAADRTGATGGTFGTPNYASPEQLADSPRVDFRSDIFSLGMTLYHMVTGRVPFGALSAAEVLKPLRRGTLPDPRALPVAVTMGCARLLRTMLARDPSARYGTWGSLLEDIARVREGGLPFHPSPSPGGSVLG